MRQFAIPNGKTILNMEDEQQSAYINELRANYNGPDALLEEGVTTLMIRNLPRIYTSEAVICEVEAIVPKGSCDFVYLPWDVRRRSNISYAFINFANPESASRCFFRLSGHNWGLVKTAKCCRITAAHVQGLAPNLAHYVASNGLHEPNPHEPVVFHNGERIPDLRTAVRMFCTPEILQSAMESLREAKRMEPLRELPLRDALAARVSPAPALIQDIQEGLVAKDILEFKNAFYEFCTQMSEKQRKSNHFFTALQLPPTSDRTMQFWARFRDMCNEYAASPQLDPDFPSMPMGEPSESVPPLEQGGATGPAQQKRFPPSCIPAGTARSSGLAQQPPASGFTVSPSQLPLPGGAHLASSQRCSRSLLAPPVGHSESHCEIFQQFRQHCQNLNGLTKQPKKSSSQQQVPPEPLVPEQQQSHQRQWLQPQPSLQQQPEQWRQRGPQRNWQQGDSVESMASAATSSILTELPWAGAHPQGSMPGAMEEHHRVNCQTQVSYTLGETLRHLAPTQEEVPLLRAHANFNRARGISAPSQDEVPPLYKHTRVCHPPGQSLGYFQ